MSNEVICELCGERVVLAGDPVVLAAQVITFVAAHSRHGQVALRVQIGLAQQGVS